MISAFFFSSSYTRRLNQTCNLSINHYTNCLLNQTHNRSITLFNQSCTMHNSNPSPLQFVQHQPPKPNMQSINQSLHKFELHKQSINQPLHQFILPQKQSTSPPICFAPAAKPKHTTYLSNESLNQTFI